ncbi:hypothetical protein ACUNWD_08360 [Sunxiuqinia sp. A32]|uniref:hypothetical protein n=1 Tax=Sunxiuqinia sp. A32 TaxID=3461496 RepID=UPI00404601B9
MGINQTYIPIYRQFIMRLKAGLQLLDETSQKEIRQFVAASQHENGGFKDRGNQVDLYYSLFGYWLASALGLNVELDKLKEFTITQKEQSNPVDRFSLMLIQQGLLNRQEGKINFFRQLVKKEYPVNFSYQLFLFLLVFDARYGRKRWMNWMVRIFLSLYRPSEDSPSSLFAALLVVREEVGLSTLNQQKELLSYFNESSGFVSFRHIQNADMLSTAVALFALKKSNFDMRLVASSCLNFIQQNFAKGAFLSGDGDLTRDLEYTFYGLLALGSLSDN